MESDSGISYTEFTYQLLQGYDFVHLCREHGVRVQVSSSAGSRRQQQQQQQQQEWCCTAPATQQPQ